MTKKFVAALILTFVGFGSFLTVRAFSPQPGTSGDPLISVSYFVQGIAPLQSRLTAIEGQLSASLPAANSIQQLEARIAQLEARIVQLERQAGTSPVAPTPTAPAVTFGIVTGSLINMRQGPGTSFAVITTLSRNTRVEIVERGAEWHRVRLVDGRTGFVHATLVSISR